jgi:hypothetical protein
MGKKQVMPNLNYVQFARASEKNSKEKSRAYPVLQPQPIENWQNSFSAAHSFQNARV